MQRHELEHILGAAALVVKEEAFVVIGSQALLGTFSTVPDPLLRSIEADLYPLESPEKADAIDGALGDGSLFHRQYGYYAHGVGPETAKAPIGWQDRLVPLSVPPRPGSEGEVIALCLEVHDLVLAKCAAGRDRDWEFAYEALKGDLIEADELLRRVDAMPVGEEHRERLRSMISGLVARLNRQ